MQGDRVKATFGFLTGNAVNANIPIYKVEVDANNVYVTDSDNCAEPKCIGGVKPGSVGTIDGNPVKAYKRKLHAYDKVAALGGNETVLLYPVFLMPISKQLGFLWISSNK